jgi:hypothetical protein
MSIESTTTTSGSDPSSGGGGLHHLFAIMDPSCLGSAVTDLLQKDPSMVPKILENLEECTKAVLQAIMEEEVIAAMAIISQEEAKSSPSPSPTPTITTISKIPAEVLHQVCQSDFLTVQEMGRLLLLVSKKDIQDGLSKERCWELICCKQWRNTIDIPKSILLRMDGGYEGLFRQRYKSVTTAAATTSNNGGIPPPRLSPNQLTLLISIYNA